MPVPRSEHPTMPSESLAYPAPAGTLASTSSGFTATLPARAATLARVQPASGLPNVIFMDGFETGTTANWE